MKFARLLCAAVTASVPVLLAQSSRAVLSGTVSDDQNKTIASARVSLLDYGNGITKQLSLRRRIALAERLSLDFRADAFNLFNNPNFANPTGVMTSANFGRSVAILSAGLAGASGQNPLFVTGGPRSMQLALKLQF